MAIDFSGYASNYGGNPQTQAQAGAVAGGTLGGILGSIPNFQERFAQHRKKDIKSSTSDYMDIATGEEDIDSFSLLDESGQSTYKDAASNYVDYKNIVKAGREGHKDEYSGKGKWFAKRAEKKGLMGASDYIDAYNQEMSFVAPMIGKKIFEKYQLEHLSDDDMKDWIQERGLSKFILDNFQADPNNPNDMNTKLREWAIPDQTLRQWASRKGFTKGSGMGALKVGGTAGALGLGAYGGYQAGKQGYKAYKMRGKGPNLSTSQFRNLTKVAEKEGLGGKAASKANKVAKKQLISSKSALTKAQNKFNKAEKAYKGKNFKATKDGKLLHKSVKDATKKVTTANSKVGKATGNILKRAIDKHGSNKVMRMVAKKLGWKGAIKFMAKFGLGGVMQLAPGVGALAAGALLASDVAIVYSIIKDLAD
tara:strand:- start:2866 stop:4131 length:1266 start_codon:yes stop_codon:yes gene_type:complete